MAYVDGIADDRIARHVQDCAYCAARAAAYRTLNRTLVAQLYRSTCPTPETLGDFHLNHLVPGQKLVVAKHLRTCALCQQELAQFGADSDDRSTVFHVVHGAIRRLLEAMRLEAPIEPSYARGAVGRRQEFRVGDSRLIMGYQPGVGVHGRLAGLIVSASQPDWPADRRLRLQLFRDELLIAEQTFNDLGHFVFESITPGHYDLLIDWNDSLILIADFEAL